MNSHTETASPAVQAMAAFFVTALGIALCVFLIFAAQEFYLVTLGDQGAWVGFSSYPFGESFTAIHHWAVGTSVAASEDIFPLLTAILALAPVALCSIAIREVGYDLRRLIGSGLPLRLADVPTSITIPICLMGGMEFYFTRWWLWIPTIAGILVCNAMLSLVARYAARNERA